MKSTLRWIAALLAVISITGAALAGDSWKTCPVSLEARSPLDQLMRRDMFYGADDYFGADRDLLGHVADVTNGQDYYVLSSSQLDLVFDEILANIYVRLIQ